MSYIAIIVLTASLGYYNFLQQTKEEKCSSLFSYYLQHKDDLPKKKTLRERSLISYWTSWYKRNCIRDS